MKKILTFILTLTLMLGLSACGKNTAEKKEVKDKKITISAAASLKEALTEIKPEFEKETGVKLTYNLESSGTLQKQIEEGAPVDVFISAAKKQMDELEKKNLIDKDSRKDLLKNELVLIVANEYKDKIKNVSDIANNDVKISLGTVESVPAGQYAKESLTNLKLWDTVKGKAVYAKDVKQVASYVERGEVAAGIVYKSDAMNLKKATIAQTFGEETHKPIVYPSAVVTQSKDKESAKLFLDYISKDKSQKIFEKYGFKLKK